MTAILDQYGNQALSVHSDAIRKFDGARVTRLTEDWITSQTSLDEDLKWQLQRLIDRCRDLEQNNEYVSGFLGLAERNVVGPDGFQLQMKIRNPDGRHDKIAEEIIENGWKKWSKPKHCTVHGNLSLTDVYKLCLRGLLRDGAPLIRKRLTGDYGFQLEVMDIDYLDPNYQDEFNGGNIVRMSVEYNPQRRPVAYWLLGSHPGENFYKGGAHRTRVPASQIIHPFIRIRANQTRGYPIFAAILLALRQLAGYKEAEIVAARTAAAKMGFLTSQIGENQKYTGQTVDTGGKYMDAASGTIEELPSGMSFQSWDPTHPTTQYGEFVKEIIRSIAFSLGVSHMNFANDPGDANYSSARVGMLEEREAWKVLQRFFIDHICEEIFDDWLINALARGRLADARATLPVGQFEKFNNPVFRGRRWQWVDPKNEAEGWKLAVDEGFTSHARVAADNGMDEEEVLDEIRQTIIERSELGLVTSERLTALERGKRIGDKPENEDPPLIATLGVGGTQGLVQIMEKIGTGDIGEEAGIEILVTVFGFKTEQARRIARRGQPRPQN